MSDSEKLNYRFNGFELDVRERHLFFDKKLVHLTSKAFETLLLLLQNKGRVVEKDDFMNKVWADTFVEEATLAQNIATLRKVLGRTPDGRSVIETVPRRGYRFVAEVLQVEEDQGPDPEHLATGGDPTNRSENGESIVIQTDGDKSHDRFPKSLIKRWASKPRLIALTYGLIATFFLFIALVLLDIFPHSWSRTLHTLVYPYTYATQKFQSVEISKLTSSGNIHRGTISHDGKYVAYVEKRGDQHAIMLQIIDDESKIEIAPPRQLRVLGLSFSRDDKSIYYVANENQNPADTREKGTLYRIPALGGPPQRITGDLESPIAVSGDGKSIAFLRSYPNERESTLVLADTGGRNERKLAVRSFAESFLPAPPSWSPDGEVIVLPAFSRLDGALMMELVGVEVRSGEQKALTSEKWEWVGGASWLGDGSGVLFLGRNTEPQISNNEIWLVSYPSGKSRRVTNGIGRMHGISNSLYSGFLTTIKSDLITDVWVAPLDNPDQATRIRHDVSEKFSFERGMDWTPDDKIIASLTKNGNADIWIMNWYGSGKVRLTSDETADLEPKMSQDGKFIAFLSWRSGHQNMWRMNPDGTEARQLTGPNYVFSLTVTPDSRWILFSAGAANEQTPYLWRIPASGDTSPVQVSPYPAYQPVISPDGKYFACYSSPMSTGTGQAGTLPKLSVLSVADGSLVKQFDESMPYANGAIAWNSQGNALIFARGDESTSDLWLQPLTGGEPRRLTNLQNRVFRFAVSKNNTLVFEAGSYIDDLILMKSVSDSRTSTKDQ